MHHIRRWAHDSAHESKYNPWHSSPENARPRDQVLGKSRLTSSAPENSSNIASIENHDAEAEPDKAKAKIPIARRVWRNFKNALFHSWVNVLLVFVPAGIAVHFAGVNPNVVFALNAIAIIPLAGLLTYATECVAHRLGPTLGALLNVSFGNAVELIIFIIALVKNEIRIVQASLIGSILANLLLILGMAFLIGGLQYREQVYDSTVTQMSACLLALAVLSLLIPTAFHASFNDLQLADEAVLKVSRGTSVILLLTYILYLLFQLKSHSYLYQGTPQHIIDEQSQPGVLARFDSTSSATSSTSSSNSVRTTSTDGGSRRKVRRRIRAKLGIKRQTKTEVMNESTKVDNEKQIDNEVGSPAVLTSSPIEMETTPDFSSATYNKGKQQDANLKTQQLAVPEPSSLPNPRLQPSRPQVSTRFSTPAVRSTVDSPTIAAQNQRRPPAALRAISSFRAPPVFRSGTNPQPLANTHSLPPHQLRRLVSSPNNVPTTTLDTSSQPVAHPSRTNTEQSKDDAPPMSQTASIVLLLCSTALVALCAEFLVGSIEHLVESSPLSEAFIGLIILPIVGNAAEHVTAVTVAAKNKLDLSLGVSLGSSIQIALFVTPVVVILGWILDKTMSLYFNLFETASLFVSTFIVNFLVLDGRSNYLEGALLCACYVILAVGAYFFPDGQNQSSFATGSGSTAN